MERKISNEDLYDLIKKMITRTDQLKDQNKLYKEELKSVIPPSKI